MFESEQESSLPLYPGIDPANIHIVTDAASAAFAHRHLSQASVLGFDTETKPVFQKGQRNVKERIQYIFSEL